MKGNRGRLELKEKGVGGRDWIAKEGETGQDVIYSLTPLSKKLL